MIGLKAAFLNAYLIPLNNKCHPGHTQCMVTGEAAIKSFFFAF
jgi:hypothetical protein